MGDAQIVSAHEYLRQQGSTCIILHPEHRLLFLGYGYDGIPRAVPHCIAYNDGQEASSRAVSPGASSWQPTAKTYETLVEVHKALHLQTPPPLSEAQSRQEQHEDTVPPPPSAAAAPGSDAFPFAKAGLVSSKQVPEGADKFNWFTVRRPAARIQNPTSQQGPSSMIPVQATGGHRHQISNSAQAPAATGGYVPYATGTQVAALWSGEPYVTRWLITSDGHIADFNTTPEHMLLDRFEAVWRWAIQEELGAPGTQLGQLSAVLLVPHTMTAAEVRFLADVILERLGFASLVVHLDSVAATFGNGATSACVVHMGSSNTSVVCVDDAVVLQPASSRRQVSVGLDDVAAALVGWMSCYRHWPSELQAADLDVACALGAAGSVYGILMMQELVMQQCYCPKESLTLGLVGQAMLEDQPPAVLPVRSPGKPTINYQVSLGSWAAVAAMVYFYPQLAPSKQQLTAAEEGQTSGSSAAPEMGNNGNDDSQSTDQSRSYQYHHAAVHNFPAAESMYLQGQLKARIEAGETSAPAVGLYLPALDMPGPSDKDKGDNDLDNAVEPLNRSGSGAGPGLRSAAAANTSSAAATGGAGAEAAAGTAAPERVPLDQAIFQSIVVAAAGRHDVFERLCNGILLTGPGASLRGLGPMLERRLMQRFSAAGRQQVVNVLEHRGHPSHMAWKGGALLAALDAGRQNWLPKHQWVQGGMVLHAPETTKTAKHVKQGVHGATAVGTPGGAFAGNLSAAAAGRHAKLCYYIKAEQGQL